MLGCLRQKRVGDILVEQSIVTAEQLLQAIEQQARMPMVRIGEALLHMDSLAEISEGDHIPVPEKRRAAR